MTDQQTIVHGTCVSVGGVGVLMLGVPGAGKSDLALKLVDQAGYGISAKLARSELVADDQVVITRRGATLVATAHATLQGKLEIRGLGIVELKVKPKVVLKLVVKLQSHSQIERLPDMSTYEILGLSLAAVEIDNAAASATARVRAAVNWLVSQS